MRSTFPTKSRIAGPRLSVLAKSAGVMAAVLALMANCLCGDSPAQAQSSSSTAEYELKAVFLFNFAKFVEWPAQTFPKTDTPITIGILGENPFGEILGQAIKNETVKDRKLVIRQLSREEDAKGCHILFVSRGERERVAAILEKLRNEPILTISETEGFAQHGGMINFVVVENTVRFEINPEAAERAGLKISSRLLTLPKAIRVQGGKEGRP